MPRISEFYGIVVVMFRAMVFHDHAPPHLHAKYAEDEAVVRIDTLEVIRGAIPRRALALVLEWAVVHRGELLSRWADAQAGRPLARIAPLR